MCYKSGLLTYVEVALPQNESKECYEIWPVAEEDTEVFYSESVMFFASHFLCCLECVWLEVHNRLASFWYTSDDSSWKSSTASFSFTYNFNNFT